MPVARLSVKAATSWHLCVGTGGNYVEYTLSSSSFDIPSSCFFAIHVPYRTVHCMA